MDFIELRQIGHINPIRQWIDEQPTKAGIKIDTRIEFLEFIRDWPPTSFKKLKGYDEIYELRIVLEMYSTDLLVFVDQKKRNSRF